MNSFNEGTKLEPNPQQISLGRQSLSARFTDITCAESSLSLAKSVLVLVKDDDDDYQRQAIIPKATCPLLVISILLSILSLTFAAVSFASAPATAVGAVAAGKF